MKPQDIEIERSKNGIFANALVFVQGQRERVTIWAKPGHYADNYKGKSDEEIRQIVFAHWVGLSAAALGSKGGSSTSDAKKESSRENGKLGGRPRKTSSGTKAHTLSERNRE